MSETDLIEVMTVRFCDLCPDHDEFRPMVQFPVLVATNKIINVYLCEKCLRVMLEQVESAGAAREEGGGMTRTDALAIAQHIKEIAFEYSQRSPAGWGDRVEQLVDELATRLERIPMNAAAPSAAPGVEGER